MGLRFRKSLKIAPGIRLNIGKKSAGVSIGGKGGRVSVNTEGRVTGSVGIPGSGLYAQQTANLGGKPAKGSKPVGCLTILAILVLIGWALIGFERLTGISLTSSSQEPTFTKELTIEELAEKENALVGVLLKSYFLPPSGGWSLITAHQQSAVTVNNKRIENVVMLEIASDWRSFDQFVEDQGYFTLFTKFGEANSDIEVTIWYKRSTRQLFAILASEKDCSDVAYVLMGGLDPERNDGKHKTIFPVPCGYN